MKEIDQKATAILLASLDYELEQKCMQLKENRSNTKLQKIFFLGCLAILISFLLQAVFRVFNFSFLYIFIVYQVLALLFLTPFVISFNRGGTSQ